MAAAGLVASCSHIAPQPGSKLDTQEVIGKYVEPGHPGAKEYSAVEAKRVNVDKKDKDDYEEATQVERLARASDEVYFHVVATALDENPKDFGSLANILGAVYADVTSQKVAAGVVTDANSFDTAMGTYAKNFMDSVAPTAAESVTNAFNITFTTDPVFEDDDYVTYKVYYDYFTGGAHPIYDVYYVTLSPSSAVCSFDTLVKKEYQMAVREALVQTIAQSRGQSVEDYLKSLNEFLNNNAENSIGVQNFPIYNVGVTDDALVFSYPEYSIGPASDGVQLYALPKAPLKEILTID